MRELCHVTELKENCWLRCQRVKYHYPDAWCSNWRTECSRKEPDVCHIVHANYSNSLKASTETSLSNAGLNMLYYQSIAKMLIIIKICSHYKSVEAAVKRRPGRVAQKYACSTPIVLCMMLQSVCIHVHCGCSVSSVFFVVFLHRKTRRLPPLTLCHFKS